MKELMIFNNEKFGEVRMVEIEGKVYGVAKDIALSLGYKNTNDAISRHCKGVVKHDSFKVKGSAIALIPQSDIIRLSIKCPLQGADKFEEWIFDEVIPSVLTNGKYDVVEQKLKQIQDVKERDLTLTIYQLETALKTSPDDLMMTLAYNTKKQELSNYINEKNIKEIASVVNTVDTKLKKLTVANEGDMTASAVAKKLNIFSTSNKPHNKFAENVARELGFYINPKDNLGYSDDYVNIRLSQVGGVELPTLMYTRKAFDEIEEYANNDMVIEQPAKYFVKGIKKGEFNFALIKFNNNDGIRINQTTYDLYTNQD